MKIGFRSDIGTKRTKNEDNFFFDQENKFFIIADGMGGYSKGEVASRIAVDSVARSLKERIDKKTSSFHNLIDYHLITDSINLAHERIKEKAKNDNEYLGMGTTIAVAIVKTDGNILIGNVGDSRIYLIKQNKKHIFMLSEDHTKLNRHINEGKVLLNKNLHDKFKHILTKCLGRSSGPIDPFVMKYSWDFGDYLILCSDGLTSMLTDEQILTIFAKNDDTVIDSSQIICDKLIQDSIKKGGFDNVTVLVAQNNIV